MPLPALPLVAGAVTAAAYLDAKYFIARDLSKGVGLAKATRTLNKNKQQKRNSIYYYFENSLLTRKDADCLVCEDVTLSWVQVSQQVNRLAHLFISRGVKQGDVVALYMPNKPAYPIIWLACLALNVVPAFINFNLTDEGLRHCITVSRASLVLYEADLSQPIAEIADSLRRELPGVGFLRWIDSFSKSSGEKEGVQGEFTIDERVLSQFSVEKIDDSVRREVGWQDPCCLIYTSGTTGLPKAAIVTHGRTAMALMMWTKLNHFTKDSRIFTPMPLYHSTAALLAIGVAWNAGATVIIGRKFSASTFWKEVREHDANVIQYVGEVLRYLLAVPPSPLDKQHKVVQAYGNGCRPDVWNTFRERFGVQTISEFFASSEGNGSLFNHNQNDFGAGAVGHDGPLSRHARRNKQCLVRVDAETEAPARDENGWCVRVDYDEDGEMICEIVSDSPFQNFAGYHGNAAGTEKKILRDVFAKGDMYFRTGDLLRVSKEGYYYFADRMGDTFRWKSENVSTQQIAEAVGPLLKEASVYGVLVPGHDGRAGCVAIPESARPINLEQLAIHVNKALPKYAVPLFVRFVDKLHYTGTSKLQKSVHRNEGVDPSTTNGDAVYWLQGGKYEPFNKEAWAKIKAGQVKL